MSESVDLGHGHVLRYVAWKPDRTIPENAERFKGVPDDDRAGAIVTHEGCEALGFIGLNPATNTAPATWTVVSWDPLTIEPSLLCARCGDHGFIREGKWVPA